MKIIISTLLSLLIAIALIVISPSFAISPGTLAEGHKNLKNNCFNCHSIFVGVTSTKCKICHELNSIGKEKLFRQSNKKVTMIHIKLANIDCMMCHVEHKSTLVESATRKFSHQFLSSEIKNQCYECHYLEVPSNKIHFQKELFCSNCHSSKSWKPASFLDHNKYFVFDKEHNSSCTKCHQNNGYSNYTCYGCHEHTEANIISEHREEGITDIANCAKCHRSGDKEEIKHEKKNKHVEDND